MPEWRNGRLQPTDQVPLIDQSMERLIRVLKEGTLGDLALELFEVARERIAMSVEKRLAISETTSMDKIFSRGPTGTFIDLLHSMTKATIEALIMGTVAYQGHHDLVDEPREKPLEFYEGHGPGAYSASLFVEGRHGWMTKEELGDVIDIMDKYIQAKADEENISDGAAQKSASQLRSIQLARLVDGYYVPAAQRNARFVYLTQRRRLGKAKMLLAMLKRFHACAPDEGYMIQAPQYVGCTSSYMSERWKAHDPAYNQYGGANFGFWLTASCMRAAGIQPCMRASPLIRLWDEGQADAAEILATMLAGSMMTERGYNSHPPGTLGEGAAVSIDWKVHQERVFLKHSWYTDSKESITATEERRRLVGWLASNPAADAGRRLELQQGEQRRVSDRVEQMKADAQASFSREEQDRARALLQDLEQQVETPNRIASLLAQVRPGPSSP